MMLHATHPRRAAREDPVGFVAGLPARAILDEVQRVPELFISIKDAIDRRRVPGRFILTGSANVLLVPRLADSLAGKSSRFLDDLFGDRFYTRTAERLGPELGARIVDGGYPAALAMRLPARRSVWYRDLRAAWCSMTGRPARVSATRCTCDERILRIHRRASRPCLD